MTEEIKKKRDELAEIYIRQNLSMVWWQPTLLMKVSHQAGFDAGYQAAMDEANERIKKLREALEFYANDTSWNSQGHFHNSRIDSTDMSKVELFPIDYEFGGKRARAALKADEEIKE